jgi:hypothetical protein
MAAISVKKLRAFTKELLEIHWMILTRILQGLH